jgi:hypothetical protein
MLLQIESPYFCAGVITNYEGIVITAAPIIKWSIGKHFRCLNKYKITKLDKDERNKS